MFAAAWKDMRIGEARVYWAVSNQPRFDKDALVHRKFFVEQNHPSLAIDTSGTVWVVWEESQPGGQQIWIRSSADSDEGRAITDKSDGWASFPVVAWNAGLVAVVYEAENNGKRSVMFQQVEPTQQ